MSASERLPRGVRHHRKPEADAIVWANRALSKDPGVRLSTFAGLLVWTPATLLLVALLASEAYALLRGISSLAQSWPMLLFSGVMLILLAWLGLRGPVYGLLRLTWTETLLVSDTAIGLFYSGLLAPKDHWIEKEAFLGIALERDPHNVGDTDFYSLRLFHREQVKGEKLAYWMAQGAKYELFVLLEGLLRERGYALPLGQASPGSGWVR